MADKKVTDLTALTQADQEDLLLIVSDPVGAPASRKITVGDFFGNVSVVTAHTANVVFEGSVTFSSAPSFSDSVAFENITTNTATVNGLTVGTIASNSIANIPTVNATSVITESATITGTSTVSGNVTFSSGLNATGNTSITNLTVLNETIVMRDKYGDPSSANAFNEGVVAGTIFFSDNYLYIAVDENTLKRVELSSFII